MGKRAFDSHSIDDCFFLKKERRQSEGLSRAVEEASLDDHLQEFYEENPD